MTAQYKVISGTYDCEGVQYIGYGVKILLRNEEREMCIFNISTEKEKVERFATLCNTLSLSPLHIYDVIEDFFF